MTTPRRFTDDEVALILARATNTPAEHGSDADPALEPAPTSGLSLTELQAIAREAGVDPHAVARAADAVARGDLVPGFMGLGARVQDVLTRRARGRERSAQLGGLPSRLRDLLPSALPLEP